MPALQVRDFPDDLYERLKACAALEHRSVAQQTVALVEEGLNARNESHLLGRPRAAPPGPRPAGHRLRHR